jgi:hypothetical protein
MWRLAVITLLVFSLMNGYTGSAPKGGPIRLELTIRSNETLSFASSRDYLLVGRGQVYFPEFFKFVTKVSNKQRIIDSRETRVQTTRDRRNYVYKENLPNAVFLTQKEIESQRNPRSGAIHILTELHPWEHALSRFDSNTKDYLIHPSRRVWVVQYYYPDGYHTKGGLCDNCLVTGFYDAETGDVFGARYKSLPNDQRPR